MMRNNNEGTAENAKNDKAAENRRKAKSGKSALVTQEKTGKKLECSGIIRSYENAK